MSHLRQLRSLTLWCEPVPREPPFFGETFGLVDEGVQQIGTILGLEDLWLFECGLADRHLEMLKPLSNLVILRLDGNPIEGSGLSALAGLKSLQSLGLSSCRLTDRGLRDFPHLDSLKLLLLTNNQIGDAAMAAIISRARGTLPPSLA